MEVVAAVPVSAATDPDEAVSVPTAAVAAFPVAALAV